MWGHSTFLFFLFENGLDIWNSLVPFLHKPPLQSINSEFGFYLFKVKRKKKCIEMMNGRLQFPVLLGPTQQKAEPPENSATLLGSVREVRSQGGLLP